MTHLKETLNPYILEEDSLRDKNLQTKTTYPCLKMRPAPRALWPTSLFPMSSSEGKPTAGPCAFNNLHRSGAVCNSEVDGSPTPPIISKTSFLQHNTLLQQKLQQKKTHAREY
jgi:hypothetical protein